MKLLFASSYHYPAYPAQFKHGLLMAREYASILGNDSLYLVLYTDSDTLKDIPHIAYNPWRLPLRRFRLISFFLFFYFGWFFLTNPKWRGSDVGVITQESKIAALLLFWRRFFKFKVVYECHGLHSALTDSSVCRRADALVFVTHKSEAVARKFGALAHAAVFPNAVDHEQFNRAISIPKAELRTSLGLPSDAYLVGYVGRFYALGFDKGISTGLKALAQITDPRVRFCFVGGTDEEIAGFKKLAKELAVENRAIFVPYQKEARKIAEYTVAMDVLMYVPPPKKFFREETSPMKLYEYMAAQKPILVSDFPALREMLSEDSAYFVKDGSPEALAQRLDEVLTQPEEAQRRAAAAYERVEQNTWNARARRIIAHIEASR